MGNQCFQSALNKLYCNNISKIENQYSQINHHYLKSQWSLLNSYKIKKLFERAATKTTEHGQLQLSFDKFCELFPEFIRYGEVSIMISKVQRKKIYAIFDEENLGYVGWDCFYRWITVCYFGEERILAILLFIIFDQNNNKILTKTQLSSLIALNATYLRQQSQQNEGIQLDHERIIDCMLGGRQQISLMEWLDVCWGFFDFGLFRKLFNIFKEEKLEKQLVGYFGSQNQLYDLQLNKYVSYLVSYKWFETWKIYVENQYGMSFDISDKNPITLKSLKTKKTFKMVHPKSKKYLQHWMTINKISSNSNTSIKFINTQSQSLKNRDRYINTGNIQQIKNIDLVRTIIGQKPKKIYNTLLEGEFAGTLKLGLVENYDYVLVSQKIWNYLNQIYNGQPEFRRTGFSQIELYPKLIRLYSGTSKGQILFCSEMYRQVSSYCTVGELMQRCLQIRKEVMDSISVYYRSVGMLTWNKITNYGDVLGELSPHPIIFLVYLENKGEGVNKFQERYLRESRTIQQANLGDVLLYEDSSWHVSKEILFFNKTEQNRYVIHFMGESYTNDLYLVQKQFYRRCKIRLYSHYNSMNNGGFKKTEIWQKYHRVDQIKNLSFVTAIILQFLQNRQMKLIFTQLMDRVGNCQRGGNQNYLVVVLGYLYNLLKNRQRVEEESVVHLVEVFFPQYSNIESSYKTQFINDFCMKLKNQFQTLNIEDTFSDKYSFTLITKVKCQKCYRISTLTEQNIYALEATIPDINQILYQIIYVPFTSTLNRSCSMKRYRFQLKYLCSLKQYREKFMEVAGIGGDVHFILVQIANNIIIKNYSYIKDQEVTLEKLRLRSEDVIFAFEICFDFGYFIKNHYTFSESNNGEVQEKDLKVGEMIDCKNMEKGWLFGKIVGKKISMYTYQTILQIVHKINNCSSQCNYPISKSMLAHFPSQSYKNSQQYHLKLIQRVFSQVNNQMVNCHMPLVITLPSWMRMKQFQYLVYMQMRRFISPQHKFPTSNSSQILTDSTIEKSIMREAGKQKIKKFKQYLYSTNFPYKLHFIDDNGHCLICYKFIKSKLVCEQYDKYCQGCLLSNDEPISWQLMIKDMVVAVDWKDIWSYRKQIIRNQSAQKKKDVVSIDDCLAWTFNQTATNQQMICCNKNVSVTIAKSISHLPNLLIISLNRIVEESGLKRKINRAVEVSSEKITVQGEEYKLRGIITQRGCNNNINYTAMMALVDGLPIMDSDVNRLKLKISIKDICWYFFIKKLLIISNNQRSYNLPQNTKEMIEKDYKIKKNCNRMESLEKMRMRQMEIRKIKDNGRIRINKIKVLTIIDKVK